MKRLFSLPMVILLTFSLFAQAPQKMSYQAVIRDAGNNLVTNHVVGMRISIIEGSQAGPPPYVETQTPTTNANGLATIEIGDGTPVSGTFGGIEWSKGTYYLQTETDPTGGTNYTIIGTNQILSVPYALYAKSAANGFSGNYNDLINKPVILNDALFSTATGSKALTSNTGEANTAHGWQALYLNTNGYNNTATGTQALWSNVSGFNNTANGAWALLHNTNGNSNTAIGYNALSANITGYSNTANGAWALYSNNTGFHNTAFGVSSLYTNEDGTDNTAVGLDALYFNISGNANTATGLGALFSNTTANGNTANGYKALNLNTIGYDNTALGAQALLSNTDGILNTAAGYHALENNTTGDNNTAVGGFALQSATTANYNTAVGALALTSNTNGYNNSSMGNQTLFSNTTGYNNTAFGNQALQFNSTGLNNTAIGNQAGNSNQTGSNNIFLGSRSGYYETGSNKLFIDNQQRANESDAREKALIYGVFDADPAKQVLIINGKIGIGTIAPMSKLDVKGEINVNSNKIINIANPVNAQDAATKGYVDALFEQLKGAGIVTDADGNTYPVVQIGTQSWMAANLKTTKYNDGTTIPLAADNTSWASLSTPGYCSYGGWNDNDQATYVPFMVFYNWYSVNTGKLCPTGWHVPSDGEWTLLEDFLGGSDVAGGKLKSVAGWLSPNVGATNESGFSALGEANRYIDGGFTRIGDYGFWWTSTEVSTSDAMNREIGFYDRFVWHDSYSKQCGFSVRCLKN
jgi:uncharacterized protein (TIGR02145 family)